MMYDVVIIGAGLSGLACGATLQKKNISFVILEAEDRPGGRVATDIIDGYHLDRGFQVLQTGYPEVGKMLDIDALNLQKFPAGVAVRHNRKFHIIADPRRHPRHLFSTLFSSVGTLRDRYAMLKLSRFVCSGSFEELFDQSEETTIEFLGKWGFSKRFITNFFVPFFAGACLDRNITASSRVLKYIFRVFADGDATIPALGMGDIPHKLAATLPNEAVRYNSRVTDIDEGQVTLEDGTVFHGREVVLAMDLPALKTLLPEVVSQQSVGESCLYYSADWKPPFSEPFLVLNGEEGSGPINNLAFPSLVAPEYSSSGKTIVAAVVLGEDNMRGKYLEQSVRAQLVEWFGQEVESWKHLRTHTIDHALPMQVPPTENPYSRSVTMSKGMRVCGEHHSLPGIQWALLSGRQTAEAILDKH